VASRWLWRLRTLAAGAMDGRQAAEALLTPPVAADPRVWAAALRDSTPVPAAQPPAPRPPVEARRLTSFSPSRVAQLIRDPYGDYCRRILGLEPLRGVGVGPDARERGTAVHAAIEAWERGEAADLAAELARQLTAAGTPPELLAFELPLWRRAAEAYRRWRDAREPKVRGAVLEATSEMTLEGALGPVRLYATADRVERLADGSLAIIDFKTGQPKTRAQVTSGLEPQLPLEAAIGRASGFPPLGPARPSELIYFRISTSKATVGEKNGLALDLDAGEEADKAVKGLALLIGDYARPDQPYLSRPRVQAERDRSDYDRLARRGEWGADEDDAEDAE
jgi:ATP-dependent helicase/nuclease subunit B